MPSSSALYYDASTTVRSSPLPSQVKTEYGLRDFWYPLREECSRPPPPRAGRLGNSPPSRRPRPPITALFVSVMPSASRSPTNLCANNVAVRSHLVNLLDDIALRCQ